MSTIEENVYTLSELRVQQAPIILFSHMLPVRGAVACGAGRGAVERSEERLAYLNETRMDFKVEKGCSTQRRAVK